LLSYKHANNVLLLAVIIVNLYTVTAPLLPQLSYIWQRNHGQQQRLEQLLAPANSSSTPPAVLGRNRLIAPTMLLEQPIFDGSDMYAALDRGIWRWPGGGTPDKGGNTVLAGHRFTYKQPRGTFYFLDKLKPGDRVGLAWSGKLYNYRVTASTTVKPSQADILKTTDQPTLTMYTCTPLWLPKDRLVVTAVLENARLEAPHE
jgi:LPXTG-site transpeptidase (sortase) family protein